MKWHLVLLAFLPCIINARVLPDHSHARIDEKPGKNENFLNAFLGNVQGNGDSSIKPLTDTIEDEKNFNSGKDDRHNKDGYDNVYSHDNDVYGHDGDSYGGDYEEEDHYYMAKINCREFHYSHAANPEQCNAVKLRDYEPDYDRDDFNKKAFCRWDIGFADKKQKQAGCLCPRTKYKCHKDDQCYWFKPKSYDSKHDEKNQGQCVHNSERFYNILANLLSKRGKKDFALKIKYSSAAAKGELPYGPWGPAIIGHQEEPYSHNPHLASLYDKLPYAYPSPNHYGYGYQPQYGVNHDAYGFMGHGSNSHGYGDYYGSMSGYGSYGHPQYEAYNNPGYLDYQTGGYVDHISPNYHHTPSYPNNQGYVDYGMPSSSQEYVPQPIYQNTGYQTNPSAQSHQEIVKPATIGPNEYQLPNREATDLLSGHPIEPSGTQEPLPTYPLVSDPSSYEQPIVSPQGYAGNQLNHVPVVPQNNPVYSQKQIYQQPTTLNYGNVPYNLHVPSYPNVY